MRVLFMGTPEFAVPTLAEIVGQGHDIAAVYTRAPAPAGRGMALRPSPVADLAARFGIPVETPNSLRGEDAQRALRAFAPDICVVVAYGLLLPKSILDTPSLGCLNLHASLLPRWRGAAPIHRAVMAGDAETGVMVMRMQEGLDTGPVAMVEKTAIGPDETTGELHDRLKIVGADLMARALAAAGRGSLVFTPQAEAGVTYARKISNDEAELDFTFPAQSVHDRVRGLSPFPGAFMQARLAKGLERVKVLRGVRASGQGPPGILLDAAGLVACGEGAIRLVTVQRAGGKPMPAEEFLRGAGVSPGAAIV